MPRFAANMSFNPIEPMKPQTSSLTEQTKPSLLQPVKAKSDTVPEASFDWNSAGLVNPLDGEFAYLTVLIFCCYLYFGSS
jgi:hypothetical protein